jgi:hypothetical protein
MYFEILKDDFVRHKAFHLKNGFWSGADVMITIFYNFLPLFCETIAAFLKNQCYDQFL